MPIPVHIRRKIAPFFWPFMWLVCGLCGALVIEEGVRYHVQQELAEKGKKAFQLTQKWQEKLNDLTQELATDARLNDTMVQEMGEYDTDSIKRALYEFTYLQGVEHAYFFSLGEKKLLSFPYTSMSPTLELVELWRNMATSSQYGTVQIHFIQLAGQQKGEGLQPFIMSLAPILEAETQTPIGGVAILLPLAEAAARHPRPSPSWFENAKAFVVDATAGEHGLMYGPLWKGGARNTPAFAVPLTRSERRKLRASAGQIAFQAALEQQQKAESAAVQNFMSAPLMQEGLRFVLLVPQSSVYQVVRPLQMLSVFIGALLAGFSALWRWWAAFQQARLLKAAKARNPQPVAEDFYTRHTRYKPQKELKFGAKKPPILEKSREKSPDRILMETILESLDKNRTTLLFQPIFYAGASQPSMYEVFLRINDEHGNVITPAQFVPIAKKYNLFPNIDIHVVMRVIGEYLQYNRDHQLPLSVNLGSETFESNQFIQTLIQRLDSEWSKNLIFEVRSEDIIKNKVALNFMKEARKLGCHFSSDYFGGGEAMLKAASKMKFNFVKLDAQKFQTAEKRKELVRLAEKAREEGLALILERIEEKTDALLASKLQIPLVQGYYLGKPKDSM